MKKRFLEKIHDFRYVIIVVIILISLFALWGCYIAERYFLAAFGTFALGYFLNELFTMKFYSKNNYALVSFGDTLLERMFKPGDWLILLPGFSIIEHKGDFLLSTEEQSLKINEKECQFKKPSKESIKVKDILVNYRLKNDVVSLYKFLTETPQNWNSEISNNLSGDFAQSFTKRISSIEEAQAYKDFSFNDETFYWVIDRNRKKSVPELDTSFSKMNSYGLAPINITIGDFVDSEKTDDSRNAIARQKLENERKASLTKSNQERTKSYTDFFIDQGYDKKEAAKLAKDMVLSEDGSRTEIGGDKNATVMVPQPTGKKP